MLHFNVLQNKAIIHIHTLYNNINHTLYFISFSGRSRKRERCLKEDLYPLVESEQCMCDELISEPWGNWSVCILPNAPSPLLPHGWRGEKEVSECGEGKQYHAMACLDQRGRLLDPSHCAETGQSKPLISPQKAGEWPVPSHRYDPNIRDTVPLAEMIHMITSVAYTYTCFWNTLNWSCMLLQKVWPILLYAFADCLTNPVCTCRKSHQCYQFPQKVWLIAPSLHERLTNTKTNSLLSQDVLTNPTCFHRKCDQSYPPSQKVRSIPLFLKESLTNPSYSYLKSDQSWLFPRNSAEI